jgi:hypothetical protein
MTALAWPTRPRKNPGIYMDTLCRYLHIRPVCDAKREIDDVMTPASVEHVRGIGLM